MYLRQIRITNLRSIRRLQWGLAPNELSAGWHVVLGTNGAGKSSLLRAVALALVGESEARALRQRWVEWLAEGVSLATVAADLSYDPHFDTVRGGGRRLKKWLVPAGIMISRGTGTATISDRKTDTDLDRYIHGQGGGWFSAGYGPFRRFAGGDKDMEKLYFSNPILARHLTLFGEHVALTECIAWLQRLQFESLEAQQRRERDGGDSGRLLARIRAFVNQPGFLPHDTHFQSVTSSDVIFVDGNKRPVPVEQLSDGFRSILSLVFELIRQLVACYGVDRVFAPDGMTVVVPGVVLVDEIDAHLHPSWQREIGFFLTRLFPALQFLVTTHSPLVCHAAARGTIFRLARPGVDEESARVTGTEYNRLVFGNVLDAYGTESFGRTTGGPSQAARVRRARLAVLNAKEMEEELTESERAEQSELRATMPTAAGATP